MVPAKRFEKDSGADMNIGDLVRFQGWKRPRDKNPPVGVIVSRQENHKNKVLEVEVLWAAGNIGRIRSDILEVVNESR
jgi:hypothetical protein